MESILKQYYPDMDMTQFEKNMDDMDNKFKKERHDLMLYDPMYEWEDSCCYEDCHKDAQDWYNKETTECLILDFADLMDMREDNITDEDKLYYDMLVCYLLKHGHLKSDNVEHPTLFMWDVWCLYQPQNVASYLKTVEVDDLWKLHYSQSLYAYLAWQEIKYCLRERCAKFKKELIVITSQPDYYFKYCLDEEEKQDLNFSQEEMETLFTKPVFNRRKLLGY